MKQKRAVTPSYLSPASGTRQHCHLADLAELPDVRADSDRCDTKRLSGTGSHYNLKVDGLHKHVSH